MKPMRNEISATIVHTNETLRAAPQNTTQTNPVQTEKTETGGRSEGGVRHGGYAGSLVSRAATRTKHFLLGSAGPAPHSSQVAGWTGHTGESGSALPGASRSCASESGVGAHGGFAAESLMLSVDALAEFLEKKYRQPITDAEIARICNLRKDTVRTIRRKGFDPFTADEIAVRFGVHPSHIWPNWWFE